MSAADRLLDPARLRRHVVLNGVAWFAPAVVAIMATPALASRLGPDRFGLLALAWAATAFYAVLDLGIGRTLTAAVAGALAAEETEGVPELIWTGSWIALTLFGTIALAGLLTAPWIIDHLLSIPLALREEAIGVVRLLASGLPIVVLGVLWRAVLEGAQQFGRINALRLPLNLITWGGPWVALAVTTDVRVLVALIVGGRAAYLLAHLPWLGDALPGAGRPRQPRVEAMRVLMTQGGWLTLSGILSPILVHLDRMLLPSAVAIATVGWYVAAGDGAMRLWLFTAALQPVLFAAIAAAAAVDRPRLRSLVRTATNTTVAVLLPSALLLGWWAEPLLRWWLDVAFHPTAVAAFRLALAAVYANAVAQVAFSVLQGAGESRLVALVHLGELALLLVLAPLALQTTGPLGLLAIWAARLTVDAIVLWAAAWRRIPETRAASPAVLWGGGVGTLMILATLLR